MTINTDDLSLGRIASGGEHPFKGALDEIRIYNRALNADEIGDIYGADMAKIGN